MKFYLLISMLVASFLAHSETTTATKPAAKKPAKAATKKPEASLTKKPAPTKPCQATDINSKLINVSESDFDKDKGTLFYDPKSCEFKVFNSCVLVSMVDKNFQIEFSDGRTIIGVIDKTSPTRPSCFHSLTNAKRKGLKVFTDGPDGAMKACEEREKSDKEASVTLSAQVSYLTVKDFNESCRVDSGNCRKADKFIRVKNGAGLVFYSAMGQQSGANLRSKDLPGAAKKYEEAYASKCEKKPTPGKPATPASTPAARST